jgi:hypothetical protein
VGVGRVVGHRTSATIVPRFLALPPFFGGAFAHRAWNPPTSSSLADERTCLLAPPQHDGARFPTLTPRFGAFASRVESAYFVVTRRRKNVTARSSSARRRAIPDAHAPRVSDGTRTRDILDHNQVLYQLSYTHHASGPIMFSGPHCAA